MKKIYIAYSLFFTLFIGLSIHAADTNIIEPNRFQYLPDELLVRVFQKFPSYTIETLNKVDHRSRRICLDKSLKPSINAETTKKRVFLALDLPKFSCSSWFASLKSKEKAEAKAELENLIKNNTSLSQKAFEIYSKISPESIGTIMTAAAANAIITEKPYELVRWLRLGVVLNDNCYQQLITTGNNRLKTTIDIRLEKSGMKRVETKNHSGFVHKNACYYQPLKIILEGLNVPAKYSKELKSFLKSSQADKENLDRQLKK